MGVDIQKQPDRKGLTHMLLEQIQTAYKDKAAYATIWQQGEEAIGHCNVNGIKYGEQAFVHLHIWASELRQKGMGEILVKKSLPYFFENLALKNLFCQPYAKNPSPNKTLEKIGFEFVKTYRTIPGSLNFEQEVNMWVLTKEKYQKITLP